MVQYFYQLPNRYYGLPRSLLQVRVTSTTTLLRPIATTETSFHDLYQNFCYTKITMVDIPQCRSKLTLRFADSTLPSLLVLVSVLRNSTISKSPNPD